MWDAVGKMSRILDNLWADKKAVPFVTVMMNGMIRAGGRIGTPVDETFENMLLEDTIPFVESRYHVRTDKWNRAIAGLSMGAYMSCDIGFAHPELFGSIGTFTASMSQNPGFAAYERPYPKTLAAGGEAFAANYKLYWRSTTPAENHPEFLRRTTSCCLKPVFMNAPVITVCCILRRFPSGAAGDGDYMISHSWFFNKRRVQWR